MQAPPSWQLRSSAAWGRAVAAREAAAESARISTVRVDDSASRLHRAVERLNQSDPRVRRRAPRRSVRSP